MQDADWIDEGAGVDEDADAGVGEDVDAGCGCGCRVRMWGADVDAHLWTQSRC